MYVLQVAHNVPFRTNAPRGTRPEHTYQQRTPRNRWPRASRRADTEGFDTVTDEIKRWTTIDQAQIDEFMDKDGIINEFALVYKLRNAFPLHYILFKQVSSHLCHEANTEQLFSLAGGLSDDNGKMDPYRLSIWVSIAANRKVFMPTKQAILERYMAKFSKGAKVNLDDSAGLDMDTVNATAPAPAPEAM